MQHNACDLYSSVFNAAKVAGEFGVKPLRSCTLSYPDEVQSSEFVVGDGNKCYFGNSSETRDASITPTDLNESTWNIYYTSSKYLSCATYKDLCTLALYSALIHALNHALSGAPQNALPCVIVMPTQALNRTDGSAHATRYHVPRK
jgi:hypothetical protein